ncbi:Peptidyl-prolyl cis-trans isomerase [Streptococcus acidominimus]|uniref:Peptidyl-prolyl cis-trans isomerase n=1 Tax=Streptococcus acidominimus TaxID=1326 RepID=A0A239XCK9_STRAI|nr:peptidylprolyl isomerase [Streptococcus acidominimus]SNV44407.1 Peptidyl-prolyl cis-trans isomerase [Streptococcus acidominimus]
MKKLFLISLIGLAFLTGCDKVERTLKGDDYVDQKEALKQAKETNEKYQKEIQRALKSGKDAFPQLSNKVAKDESQVILSTSMGDINIKLFPKYAPLAVENFITHAKEGYYDGLTFHRVIKDFMIQTGDPNGDGTGGQSIWKGKDDNIDSGSGFKNEVTPYLFNLRGALAMANAGPDTNGSQFFINQNPNNQAEQLKEGDYPAPIIEAYKNGGNLNLDGDYTVFGQVISGMDIVDKIAAVETSDGDKPKEDVTIKTITIKQEANLQ